MAIAWGSKTSAPQLTSITTEQFFGATIALEPNQTAQVQVRADFPGSPTDHLEVRIYRTLDDSSEDWDTTPADSFVLPNTNDPAQRSFMLSGGYRHRIGVRRTGTTDTITSADLSYRVATLT